MKKLFYLFACVAAGVAAVAFTGCNDNKEEPASEIIVQSDVNVAVDKTGGPQVIKFTTNYDWTIKVTTDPPEERGMIWVPLPPAVRPVPYR